MDLDVNWVRVLTVQHDNIKKAIVLENNDKNPPEILATLNISGSIKNFSEPQQQSKTFERSNLTLWSKSIEFQFDQKFKNLCIES